MSGAGAGPVAQRAGSAAAFGGAGFLEVCGGGLGEVTFQGRDAGAVGRGRWEGEGLLGQESSLSDVASSWPGGSEVHAASHRLPWFARVFFFSFPHPSPPPRGAS